MEEKEKQVYTLTETYKDNDPDVIGAYDSKHAMVRGFAKQLALEVVNDELGFGDSEEKKSACRIAKRIAVVLADLVPTILGAEEWGRDEEGYCRYGKSVFGYDTMPLESVEDDEVDDEDEEEDGDE